MISRFIAGRFDLPIGAAAGAGGMLLEGVVTRAAALGLHAVFAVTVSPDAAEFFSRRGFTEVPRTSLPEAKWTNYDEARLAVVRCFWREVS